MSIFLIARRQVVFFLLLVSSLIPNNLVYGKDSIEIYSDELKNAVTINEYWGEVSIQDTAQVRSGNTSIKFVPENWAAVDIKIPDSIKLSDYSGIRFWILRSSIENALQLVFVADNNQTVLKTVVVPNTVPGEWAELYFSFNNVGLNTRLYDISNFRSIWIQDTSGRRQGAVYFDDIAFVDAGSQTGVSGNDEMNVTAVSLARQPAGGVLLLAVTTTFESEQAVTTTNENAARARRDPFLIEYLGKKLNLGNPGLINEITAIINIFLSLVGIVLVLVIIYSGFLWMLSGGDEEKTRKAKSSLFNAIIGVVIILGSYSIVQFIINSLSS